jgi:hypothetical protein
MLLAHLEKVILSAMTTDGDSLYSVKFAEAVRAPPNDPAKKGKNPKPPPQPKPGKAPKPPAPNEDGVKDEEAVSGDDDVE